MTDEFTNEERLVFAVRDLVAAVIEGTAQITAAIEFGEKAHPRTPEDIAATILVAVGSGAYNELAT